MNKDKSFNAKKRFGQNFLTSPDIPRRIAENCGADKHSAVLEIGPGKGILTLELSKIAKKVCAVEIDTDLEQILSEKLFDAENVSVVFKDFLDIDLNSFVNEHFGDLPLYVCANLPYYITTPIIMKLLESGVPFRAITIMVQKEVAERLCAKPATEEYGAITAALNYYSDVKRLFKVPAGCFTPKPKVDSAVIQLTLPPKQPVVPKSKELFFQVIRAAFGHRRKTLGNNLYTFFNNDKFLNISKEEIAAELTTIGLDPEIRGEKLGTFEFCIIADRLYERLIKSDI